MSNPVKLSASHKFYWPGRDTSYVCEGHLPKLKLTCATMGLPLVIEPLDDDQSQLCMQVGSCPITDEVVASFEAAKARREGPNGQ